MVRFARLARDARGAAAVEFGLVAPVFLTMLLGVFQMGMWMQSYNAMRNAVTETARSVGVEFQISNKLTDKQIEDLGLAVATTEPYMLQQDRIDVDVADTATQTFTAAREKKLTITYEMPTFLDFAGIGGPTVTYSRSLFVVST